MSDPAPVVLPAPVAALLATLAARGFEAHVVGTAAEALLRGAPVRDFEIATSADVPALLALFSRAIPLPSAKRLLLPTAAGPAELVPRSHGGGLLEELAHRDFTLHAIALDASGRPRDPFDGRADLAAGRLRCVGEPAERFAEDPLRRLRAARLVSTRGLEPDASLERALAAGPDAFAGIAATRLRAELHPLLLGPGVGHALALLRRSGLEAALASGVADDATAVVAALPPDLELRLAGWLRGARPVRTLRRLREPRPRVVAIERLLQLHPIDAPERPGRSAHLARLARRTPSPVPGLIALRAAEIEARDEGPAARERLADLRARLERAHAAPRRETRLALGGREVMEILGCGPGPEVGRALGRLAKDVAADPACNTPDALRERLLAWRAGDGD